MKTVVSVALSTFNGEKYIRQQLESILSQTCKVDEIIVCDDSSTDNTLNIINLFKNNNPNIKLFRNKRNIGTIKNFEKAISLTTGDLIFLSDQDDIWYPDKVKIMTEYFLKKKKCLMLFTNGSLIDDENNNLGSTLWEKWNFNDNIKETWKNNENAMIDLINNRNKVTGATIAFKSELKNDFLPINTPIQFWHDTWIAMHAAYRNGLYFLDKVTINYRIHENQQVGIITTSNYTDKSFISEKIFKKYLLKMFPEFYSSYIPAPQKRSLLKRIIKKIKRISRVL